MTDLKEMRDVCFSNLTQIDGEDAVRRVDEWRRECSTQREAMIGFQKEAGKHGDQDAAKFFKEEAADNLKSYRGACLVQAWLEADPPGDCVVKRVSDWPPEILPYALRAIMIGGL